MTSTLNRSLSLSIILCGLLGSANMAFGMDLDSFSEDECISISQPNRTLFVQSKTNRSSFKVIKGTNNTQDLLPKITNPTVVQGTHTLLSNMYFDATTMGIIKKHQKKERAVFVYNDHKETDIDGGIIRVENEAELQKRLAQQQYSKQSNQSASSKSTTGKSLGKKPNSSSPQPNKYVAFIAGVGLFGSIALLVAMYGYGFSPTQFFKNLLSSPSATA